MRSSGKWRLCHRTINIKSRATRQLRLHCDFAFGVCRSLTPEVRRSFY
jgi:hypothetical protein